MYFAEFACNLVLSVYLFSSISLSKFFFSRCLKILKGEFQRDLSKKYGIKALKYLSVDWDDQLW